jgi:hypothetical protein
MGRKEKVSSPKKPLVIHLPHDGDQAPSPILTPVKTAEGTRRDDIHEDLVRNYAGMALGKLKAPTPENSPEAYSTQVVQSRIAYFMQEKRRVLTPRSLLFTDLYIDVAHQALKEMNPTKKLELQEKIFVYDNFIQRNSFLSKAPSQTNHILEKELLRLREYDYIFRYGDYLAVETSRLKTESKLQGILGNEWLQNAYWTAIRFELDEDLRKIQSARVEGRPAESEPRSRHRNPKIHMVYSKICRSKRHRTLQY